MSFDQAVAAFVADEIRKTRGIYDWTNGSVRELTDEDVIEVKGFEFEWSDGYYYSSYTAEDPSFTIIVRYLLNGDRRDLSLYKDEVTTMGDFLNQLLAHEGAR